MASEESIYRSGYDIISKGELYKRLEIGITYSGNVQGIGYVDAISVHNIKVYLNEEPIGGYTLDDVQALVELAEEETTTDESDNTTSQILTGIGVTLSLLSFVAEMKLQANNYDYLSRLVQNGQFLGNKNGKLVVMGKSHLSTPRMRAIRGLEQAKFLKSVERLDKVKWGGRILSALGVGIPILQLFGAETDGERFEYGLDAGVGVIGFMGILGAAFSLNYSIHKPLYPSMKENELERAKRIEKGDYSMWWKTGVHHK